MKLIVATDEKNGIAKDGKIPWRCKEDMEFFRFMTIGGTVIMGSKTFDSLPNPLKMRKHIILTRDKYKYPNHKCISLGDFYQLPENEDMWIIGGEFVYGVAIASKNVTEIYQSVISGDYGCDQFFPEVPNWFYQAKHITLSENCKVTKYFRWNND